MLIIMIMLTIVIIQLIRIILITTIVINMVIMMIIVQLIIMIIIIMIMSLQIVMRTLMTTIWCCLIFTKEYQGLLSKTNNIPSIIRCCLLHRLQTISAGIYHEYAVAQTYVFFLFYCTIIDKHFYSRIKYLLFPKKDIQHQYAGQVGDLLSG